jgi:hypothetical protein
MKASPSALGRLLEEISWEGNARRYREGGRGLENVLAIEVFQSLDFLPRTAFLGRVVNSIEGGHPKTLRLLAEEIEEATLDLLPGDIYLAGRPPSGLSPVCVQPDGILKSPSVYCLLEAKRLKRGAFQIEQLAREFLMALQEAQDRIPLVVLVLPAPPPIPVRGYGRLSLHDAVTRSLQTVLERTASQFPPMEDLVVRLNSVIAYTTWGRVAESVEASLRDLTTSDPSVRASITRLARTVLEAIRWHS